MSNDETKPFFLNELELLKLVNGSNYFASLVAFIKVSLYDKIRDNTIDLNYLRSLNIDLKNFISQELRHPASINQLAIEYLRAVIDEMDGRISLLGSEQLIEDHIGGSLKDLPKSRPTTIPLNQDRAPKKIPCKIYYLAYLFDCDVKGEMPIDSGRKKDLETKGAELVELIEMPHSPNTFYKQAALKFDRNRVDSLSEVMGGNWRDLVLRVCQNRDTLDKYLIDKNL